MSEKLIDVDMWVESHERGTKDTRSTGSHGGAGFSQSSHVDRADRADIADRAETADEANRAKESDHAETADEANRAKKADKADEATTADEAYKAYKLLDNYPKFKGVTAEEYVRTKEITSQNIQNSDTITTKNINVTGKATFFELEIQKAKAAGGMSVNSAGTFHIDAVEEMPDGFVCYQRAEKDGVTLLQTCEVKDQMMCSNGMNSLPIPLQGRGDQTNDGKPHAIGNHYYWRLVTDAPTKVVTHTIDGKEEKCLKLVLSKTDHSKNTVDIPKVGDDLVQIGNRDNKERQSVIMTCAYNSFDGDLKAPYWVQYDGVNDYKLSTHKRTWFAANGSQVTGNFKVQSDNGGLESIEDYMKGLATNTYKLVMSSSQFNVKADGSFSPQFISIYAYKDHGESLTQLSPSKSVKVVVTKGESKVPLLNDNKESLAVRSDRWNLWADKDNMPDVFNVELFIKDKLVDKQKLVDMQKIHIVRDGKNGQDAKVWHVAFSIRNITGKKGETFKLKYGRTVGESTSWYDDSPTNHGFNQLYAVIIDDATGNKHQADLGADLNVADFFTGGSMTVRLMNSKTGELLAQDTIYPEAKQGKDAVIYKLIPLVEYAMAYFKENKENKNEKDKKIGIQLAYKIQKVIGEQVSFVYDLEAEDMALTILPSVGNEVQFTYKDGWYGLSTSIGYREIPNNSYTVTLTKGSDIVDQRIVPITFKPKVVFDIDTEKGEINSRIEAANGQINSVERNLKKTKATVGDLSKQYSQLEIKSNQISLTVNNGTRPNLLWGSDLDLSEVQDKIKLAYYNGDVIQQNTAKKEELQRQLDATATGDTAKRNDLQKQINDCDNKITAARNKVSECRAAIHKHLGVGLNSTKIDSREWFEYLKGRGISGADALKFKAMKGTAEFTGLFWEVWSGGTRNLQLKPNTVYTLSAWVRTEFDKNAQGYGKFAFEAFKARKEDLGERVGRLSFKETDSWFEPINEWTRVSTTFTTEELLYGSVAMWVNGTKPATLYICRPKLEEGNKATPWCAYDGTVEALLASGFSLKDKEFTATFDNFKVQNNKGEQTFFVDEKGRINNGMLVSKLRLTEPTIITNENYKKFCYKGKLNGHNVLFLDLLKCGTLLVLTDVQEELYLDLPSFRKFEKNNPRNFEEATKAQYDKMRYIGNTVILYNIQSKIVSVSGTLKYKRMAGVKDMNFLDEFGFYTKEMLPCRGAELVCFECKFGITRPEGNGTWDERQSGVYWEYCYVTIR